MAEKNKTAQLERAITRFYERYSAKRVAMATLLVGFLSLGGGLVAYSLFGSGLIAALGGFLVGFVGINIAFLTVVPPASSLNAANKLICSAIKEPSRIKSYDMQKVRLADSKGKVHTLGARDLGVWKSLVVPFLIQQQIQTEPVAPKKEERTLTASERKYIEQRRKEVVEMEKSIMDERSTLEKDRRELEIRGADLKEAEEMVIARLTGVEQAEAELEQLKIVAAERADVNASAYDAKAAEAKAAELRAKEAELSELRERLAKDRERLDTQKAELESLEVSVTSSPFPDAELQGSGAERSLEAREAALEARLKQLEEEAQDLEERATYVADSENALIERLDELSHREASIEQSEINAGLRKD